MSEMGLASTGKGVPQVFRTASQIIQSFDFTDIASGTGYSVFYGATTSTIDEAYEPIYHYLLTDFAFAAVLLSAEGSSTAYNDPAPTVIDLDFDVLINRPLILRGKALVTVPFSMSGAGLGYVYVKLRKYSNGVETEIASSKTQHIFATTSAVKTVDINITGTSFSPGDIFRLTIEGHCRKLSSLDPTAVLHIDFDPNTVDKKLILYAPWGIS